jgi:hypothetical protein
MRKSAKLIIGIILILGFWNIFSLPTNQDRLKFALNLAELPKSVRNLKCLPSDAVTDVIIECQFKINEIDFDMLRAGRDFKEYGPYQYIESPSSFKNGGELTLRFYPKNSTAEMMYYRE